MVDTGESKGHGLPIDYLKQEQNSLTIEQQMLDSGVDIRGMLKSEDPKVVEEAKALIAAFQGPETPDIS